MFPQPKLCMHPVEFTDQRQIIPRPVFYRFVCVFVLLFSDFFIHKLSGNKEVLFINVRLQRDREAPFPCRRLVQTHERT